MTRNIPRIACVALGIFIGGVVGTAAGYAVVSMWLRVQVLEQRVGVLEQGGTVEFQRWSILRNNEWSK